MAAFMKNFLLPNAANADDLNDLMEEESTPLETPLEAPNKMVWVSMKPSGTDIAATELFLQFRKDLSDKFDDKKTVKSHLWSMIASKLNDAGYNVGDRREGAESQMHGILGKKDKVYPQNLQDSLDESDVSMNDIENNSEEKEVHEKNTEKSEEGTPKGDPSTLIKNRFKSNRILQPKSANAVLVDVMKQQHKELQTSRENEYIELKKMIESQNEQRERFLNQFERLVTYEVSKKKERGLIVLIPIPINVSLKSFCLKNK
ncbi:unnamed protein product [Ceutorhynchus assimilis]|uniref:Uncharacterized protein n=1 Tax=Ceutorhynchus assimilis TaxID=467358 RepID=A0A9N9MFI4_9CUCU|nr:unnamed protein product [Ceutorhynchus assimilis]